MSKLSFSIAGILLLALVFSCKQNKQEPTSATPLVIQSRSFQLTKGKDCDKMDSLRTDCAIIDFSVPELKAGSAPQPLINAVDLWADKYLVSLLTYSDYPADNPGKVLPTVDAAVRRFHEMHDDAAGGVVAGQFAARTSYETLLNDGKYLTLQINGYCYQGGNHALEDDVEIATFDVATGKQFNWDGIVKDKQAFFALVEQKFREARAKDFVEGFQFDKETKFVMPDASGLTPDGILLHYADNEIYGIAGATDITVPYGELGSMLRIEAPKPQSGSSSDLSASKDNPKWEFKTQPAKEEGHSPATEIFVAIGGSKLKVADAIGEFSVLDKAEAPRIGKAPVNAFSACQSF